MHLHLKAFPVVAGFGALALGTLLSACASRLVEPQGAISPETVWAVTADHQLIRFNGGQPGRILERKGLTGLVAGERVLGIDYRVARGVMYALTSSGYVYTVDTSSGELRRVTMAPLRLDKPQVAHGFDFNPAADRIRVVNESGLNLRIHPDTGSAVDSDPAAAGVQVDGALAYSSGDQHAGVAPHLAAAAYTYNPHNDKITTNFAIDAALGVLVIQGSREGDTPVISPNTGRLSTVGSLGLGRVQRASFDISDVKNTALAAMATAPDGLTRLYQVDLLTGKATLLGTIADGKALVGMAIEP